MALGAFLSIFSLALTETRREIDRFFFFIIISVVPISAH